MPNLQSKSLETTVLALFDLTVHPPNGHNVHGQFTTLRPLEDTLSTLSRDQTVMGDLRRRLKASAIEQNTPLHTFWSSARPLTWFGEVRCSCGIRKSRIQPVRSTLTTLFHRMYVVPRISGPPRSNSSGQCWPNDSAGVRETKSNHRSQ